jgi:trigger factor
LGLQKKEDLNNQIKHNLEHEKQHKAQQDQDLEIINTIIEKTKFEDIPDTLINSETRKMLEELKDNVARQGLKFEDYLNHLKKKESDLLLDFTPDAIKRVKTALAIRQIATNENISASHDEIHEEMDKTLKSYQMNPAFADQLKQIEENIHSEASHRYFSNVVTNRKVMEMLRKIMVK